MPRRLLLYSRAYGTRGETRDIPRIHGWDGHLLPQRDIHSRHQARCRAQNEGQVRFAVPGGFGRKCRKTCDTRPRCHRLERGRFTLPLARVRRPLIHGGGPGASDIRTRWEGLQKRIASKDPGSRSQYFQVLGYLRRALKTDYPRSWNYLSFASFLLWQSPHSAYPWRKPSCSISRGLVIIQSAQLSLDFLEIPIIIATAVKKLLLVLPWYSLNQAINSLDLIL